jgi:quercetin dioxygenase-like cupin family protein
MTAAAPQPRTEEVIVRNEHRDITILIAHDDVSVTRGGHREGQQVAGAHIHTEHTDAFYVLEGELTLEIGREPETVTLSSGDFIAVPPGVAHSLRNDGDGPVRALSIHARDGGFANFMRGLRDGVDTAWDIASVPPGGGRPAHEATIRRARAR